MRSPERTKLDDWLKEPTNPWKQDDLETQVAAYLSTYPGRTLKLVVELLAEAADREEETE